MTKIFNLHGEKMDAQPELSADDCIEEMVKDLVEQKAEIESLIFLGVTKDGVNFVQSSLLTLEEVIGLLEIAKFQALLGEF